MSTSPTPAAVDDVSDMAQVAGKSAKARDRKGSIAKASIGEDDSVVREIVQDVSEEDEEGDRLQVDGPVVYKLYKRRWAGLVGLVALNFVGGMANPWFGPIANNVSSEFGFSLDQVNWFGNVVNLTFLPFSLIVPLVCSRYGIRPTCLIGAAFLILSAWIRFAGNAQPLAKESAYARIIVGQILHGIAQPVFLVISPLFSETWFSLKGRTTVTMVLSVANPIGGAIGQVISPVVGSTRTSILVLAIISTVVAPFALLVGSAPPTPPTYSASQDNPPMISLIRAILGMESSSKQTYMTVRERFDFGIVTLNFGVLVGVVTSFSILTNQDFGPYGYSSDLSGFMGATLLLTGLVAAIVTSPIFDRVLTRHLALTCKVLCPILGVLWLSLIWAAKPNNAGGLFAIMALIGACSLPMLPVALELAVEVTRNADASSAVLWFAGNLVAITCVLVEGALRAGPDADPPLNMHRGLIFQGTIVCCVVTSTVFLRGKQARRERDERRLEEEAAAVRVT